MATLLYVVKKKTNKQGFILATRLGPGVPFTGLRQTEAATMFRSTAIMRNVWDLLAKKVNTTQSNVKKTPVLQYAPALASYKNVIQSQVK